MPVSSVRTDLGEDYFTLEFTKYSSSNFLKSSSENIEGSELGFVSSICLFLFTVWSNI